MEIKKEKKTGVSNFGSDIILSKEKVRRLKEEGEERVEDINESLSEIYRDEEGRMIDVDRLRIKKKRGVIFWFFNFLLIGLFLVVLSLGFFYYIYGGGTDSTAVEFSIESADQVSANEEFFYTIKYRNLSNIAITNIVVNAKYPENFIFAESVPAPLENTNAWKIERVGPRDWGEIKVKGKIIGKPQTVNILLAEMTYIPENFSSEFMKEVSFRTTLKDIGLSVDLNYPTSSLVNEENEIILTLVARENNYFNEFEMEIAKGSNVRVLGLSGEENSKLTLKETEDASWIISNFSEKEEEVTLKYRVTEKKKDKEEVGFKFSYSGENGEKIVFLEEKAEIEVLKSDLNLSLIVNGSQNNAPINFGETLNYSIAYANRGEAAMKNVVIMIALESDFLDWTTLKDPLNGREKGDTIIWSEEEIPALAKIEVGGEGVVDFSINAAAFRESELGGDFRIISFAQYNIGELETFGEASSTEDENLDNKSNTIISQINSDLSLEEQVRYFNEDNLPVGTGPLPPQVGEETTLKVYWTLNNNLHELNDLKVEMTLPENIGWAEKNRTSVGSISYDEASRKVVWQIGRLPITVYRSDAEFSIKVVPVETDRNKVMVLTSGSKVSAKDINTDSLIERTTFAKTTKLEDDEIASMSSDGRVR